MQYFWSIAPDLQIEGATLLSKHLIMYYLIYTIIEDEETLGQRQLDLRVTTIRFAGF